LKHKLTAVYTHAIGHPVRQELLRLIVSIESAISPVEASRRISVDLSKAAYHMRVLKEAEVVVLVEKKQVRGATEHFYRPVQKAVEHPVIKAILDEA